MNNTIYSILEAINFKLLKPIPPFFYYCGHRFLYLNIIYERFAVYSRDAKMMQLILIYWHFQKIESFSNLRFAPHIIEFHNFYLFHKVFALQIEFDFILCTKTRFWIATKKTLYISIHLLNTLSISYIKSKLCDGHDFICHIFINTIFHSFSISCWILRINFYALKIVRTLLKRQKILKSWILHGRVK